MQVTLLILLLLFIICMFVWLLMTSTTLVEPSLGKRDLSNRINALLPQTQCGKCNYTGCQPYAEAISRGEADINLCPPGGDETIKHISSLLGRDYKPMDSEYAQQQSYVALIDEQLCIGCVKCIKACPVDAIIGAAKQMHTVINKACTACELCISPCPVDCIQMVPVNVEIKKWVWTKPQAGFEIST